MHKKCLKCPDLGTACKGPRFSEMSTAQVKEFLIALKEERDWTNQFVADRTNTPITTVTRIFARTDTTDFRHDTLRPILALFVGEPDPEPICGDNHELQNRIRALEAENSKLSSRCADLKESREAAINAAVFKAEADAQKKIDFLKDELTIYRRHGKRWRKISTACVSGVIALLLAVSVFLLVDRLNPKWGIFWRDDTSSIFGSMTTEEQS